MLRFAITSCEQTLQYAESGVCCKNEDSGLAANICCGIQESGIAIQFEGVSLGHGWVQLRMPALNPCVTSGM